jgi:RNA polymerase sigma factor (sigma-70 family)
MQPSDESLIAACRRGDAAAWETLSARYRQLVYAVCRAAGLDREQAADTCQSVFAILVEKLDAIEQPARISAWLVTTARRQAWHMRQRERAAPASIDAADLQPTLLPDSAPPPDELVVRLEEQHNVRAALAALDGRCQQMLALMFYRPDPAPYAEIAAALSIPPGSIGPTRARCLHKLHDVLARLGFFDNDTSG